MENGENPRGVRQRSPHQQQQQQLGPQQGLLNQTVRQQQQQFVPASSVQQNVPISTAQQQFIPTSSASQPTPPHPPQAVPTDALLVQLMQMMQQQQNQHQQMMQQQQTFLQSVVSSMKVQAPPNPEQILDSLASNIKEFRYEADSNITFAAWYCRYDDLFEKDAARLDEEAKVRLLMRKLGAAEHERYVSYILPSKPKDFNFEQTVTKLKSLFGSTESVISRRYRCLQMPTEDHVVFACRVNKACVEFDLGRLTEEQFKCLVYVCGLKSESDVELRTRLLSKIEERDDVTLEQLSEECQRLFNLKHDSAMIESTQSFDQVHAIQQKSGNRRTRTISQDSTTTDEADRKPKSPCWFCGAFHYVRDCNYREHKCSDCDRVGHREGYCSSARKSSKKRNKQFVSSNAVVDELNNQEQRRFVSVLISGAKLELQLDTASDITVISREIWNEIGRPKLLPATVNVNTASGSILPIDGEFYSKITIGGNTRCELIRVTEKDLQLLGCDIVGNFNLWSRPIDTFCSQSSSSMHVKPTLSKAISVKTNPPTKTELEKKETDDSSLQRSLKQNDLIFTDIHFISCTASQQVPTHQLLPSLPSSAASPESEPAASDDTEAEFPLGSSTVRRAPRWFDPYHLY